jgi:hypothetical protein
MSVISYSSVSLSWKAEGYTDPPRTRGGSSAGSVKGIRGRAGCSVYAEHARRPGAPGEEKVTLCHKGKKTLEVAEPAARARYDHGDTPGPCR